MVSRRTFLKFTLAAGGGLFFPLGADIPGWDPSRLLLLTADILDPLNIPKFGQPLVIPPVMPSVGTPKDNVTRYEIAVRQFQQQVLPAGLPKTTVWGYGRAGDPLPEKSKASSFNFPAFTVETRTNQRVRVAWVNHLVDDPASGSPQFVPHLLPVDQTLHWANPPGPADMEATMDPKPYTGPVPIVTHVHGAHVAANSDGFPTAWYLPKAANTPKGYTTRGTAYKSVEEAPPGTAVFEYTNDQPATTLWYHDHSLGITRLNVYAGTAGFWIIRDEIEDSLNLPGPAPRLDDAPGKKYYEIPIVIQDRTFRQDGSLFYPDSREFFDEYKGPFRPKTDVPPIWNPEFFGNAITVNGRTWPYLEVEPRLYRLRFLNGCNSRFVILKFDRALQFHQIGSEGGLLPDAPVALDQLLMAPAERADVIVDFSSLKVGQELLLLNLGPDEPFGGLPVDPTAQANPKTTGQVMKFRVVELTKQGNPGVIPSTLPKITRLQATQPERFVVLNEKTAQDADIPVEGQLGTQKDGPLDWGHDSTENPKLGSTEVWNIVNVTQDAHPIHLHLVQFQVVGRLKLRDETYHDAYKAYYEHGRTGQAPNPMDFVDGKLIEPNPWERGRKDTVIANPGEITQIIAHFDMLGQYVWHCHILEHEDNEMMRPYNVVEVGK